MYSASCANTHHDVAILKLDGIVIKNSISQGQNRAFH